ncbi:MFS general substrate transporter [Backusella circina FSU 941]|nr:MFS general substrate transporter [Backusella circina FSU 941]
MEPDGGYGWFVVLCGFCVMQDYLHRNVFNKSQSQLIQLSFVGTMIPVVANAFSPFVQIAVSLFGFRAVMLGGSMFIVIGLELAGQSTKIWHLYLTQGLLFGIGISCLYTNVMAIAPHWFTKKRGVAMGIMGGGTAAGGLVVPFIMSSLNQALGPSWTYHILGFICLAFTLYACVFVKEQRVSTKPGKKKLSEIVQLKVLKNKNYLFFIIAANLGLFGNYIPYFYLPSFATYYGLTESQGSSLIAAASASGFVGRIVAGVMADKLGYFNSFIISNLIAGLSSLLVWSFAKSYGPLLCYAMLFGFSSNTYYNIMPPIVTTLLPEDQFYSGLTLALLTNCIPIFGNNISSVIQNSISTTPFFTHIMFTGVSYVFGAVLLFGVKLRLNKRPLAIV